MNLKDEDECQPLIAKRARYPRSIFFIISNEFCERFNYYGMRGDFVTFKLSNFRDFNFEASSNSSDLFNAKA